MKRGFFRWDFLFSTHKKKIFDQRTHICHCTHYFLSHFGCFHVAFSAFAEHFTRINERKKNNSWLYLLGLIVSRLKKPHQVVDFRSEFHDHDRPPADSAQHSLFPSDWLRPKKKSSAVAFFMLWYFVGALSAMPCAVCCSCLPKSRVRSSWNFMKVKKRREEKMKSEYLGQRQGYLWTRWMV